MISQFELKIYKGSRTEGETEYEAAGEGDEWSKYSRISFSGFDGSIKLSLEDFWQFAIENKLEAYQRQLEGYESIVKFGDVMQLKEQYTAVLKAKYK